MPKTVDPFDISKINGPDDVKKLSKKEILGLEKALREEILKETSLHGGHLSPNLGAVELSIALCRSFDPKEDKILFDVGHQTYAYKLLTGRSIACLGEEGQEGRFADRSNPFDATDAGHSSTSLSLAEGFAIARDLKGEKHDVVAVIGDASIANGLAFEALNSIGEGRHKLIVILNDNAMSIGVNSGAVHNFFRRISTGRFYMKLKAHYRQIFSGTPFAEAIYRHSVRFKNAIKGLLINENIFDMLGFTYIGTVDGHDVKAIEGALTKAKRADKPVIVHLLTQKGMGYKKAEMDKEGAYHMVPPFSLTEGLKENNLLSFPSFAGSLVHDALKEDERRVLIDAAMTYGSHLGASFRDFPNRSFDVGIAEEHAATLSSGLAEAGLHPILSLYSTFLQRAYDEMLHDLGRKGLDATLLIDRAGLPGKNGATHAGIYDVAFLKTIPGVTISMPSNKEEFIALFRESLKEKAGLFALRYPDEPLISSNEIVPDLSNGYRLFKDGKEAETLLIVGPEGRILGESLTSDGYKGQILLITRLYPIPQGIFAYLRKTKRLIVYDPYGAKIGFAESLLASLYEEGLTPKVLLRTLPDAFIRHGTKEQQLRRYELDLESMESLLLGKSRSK